MNLNVPYAHYSPNEGVVMIRDLDDRRRMALIKKSSKIAAQKSVNLSGLNEWDWSSMIMDAAKGAISDTVKEQNAESLAKTNAALEAQKMQTLRENMSAAQKEKFDADQAKAKNRINLIKVGGISLAGLGVLAFFLMKK